MFSASLIKQIKEQPSTNKKHEYDDNIIVRSADEVMHYIRMRFYNTADKDSLKALLLTMTKTPLRHPAVIQMLKKYENSSIDELHNAIKPFTLDDTALENAGLLDNTKDMSTIIDLYLDEEDNELAFNMLREMIFLPFASKDAWNAYVDFIRNLKNSDEETKGGRIATEAVPATTAMPKGKYLKIGSQKKNVLKPIVPSVNVSAPPIKIDTAPSKSTISIPPLPSKTPVKELFVSKAQWGSFNI